MLHIIPSPDSRYAYSRRDWSHTRTAKILRHSCRKFDRKIVRWVNFPFYYREIGDGWLGPRYIVDKTCTFVGSLLNLETETAAGYTHYGSYRRHLIIHEFILPSIAENLDAVLFGQSLKMSGDSCRVLMDLAMENGIVLGQDFEIEKMTNFVVVKSQLLREFIGMNLEGSSPFEIILRISHRQEYPIEFLIDDMMS